MKKNKDLTKFNGFMIKAIGLESMVLIYKLYDIYLGGRMTLGGTVPSWFVFLILLVPISPLVGKTLKGTDKGISDDSDIAELINELKGDK